MMSPPGGGSVTLWQRATSGPARRIDARIRAQSTGSSALARTSLAWMRSEFRVVQSACTPVDVTRSTSVSTSRMRGTFSSVTGWSVRSAAAMIGSAAFLFPDGRMLPFSRCDPSTTNCGAAMWTTEGGCER